MCYSVLFRVYAILEEQTLDFYATKRDFIDHNQALNDKGIPLSFYKIHNSSPDPSYFHYGLDEDLRMHLENGSGRDGGNGLRAQLAKLFVFFLFVFVFVLFYDTLMLFYSCLP